MQRFEFGDGLAAHARALTPRIRWFGVFVAIYTITSSLIEDLEASGGAAFRVTPSMRFRLAQDMVAAVESP